MFTLECAYAGINMFELDRKLYVKVQVRVESSKGEKMYEK